jgi:hypothetical protein
LENSDCCGYADLTESAIESYLKKGGNMKRTAFLGIVCAALALASCATQPAPTAFNPPGFLMGLLHGFISLFSLIGSAFTDVRIYAFPNNGGWYDFGFVLGALLFYGGGGGAGR